jgi:hypothetical protein
LGTAVTAVTTTARAGELYGRPWSEHEYILVLDVYFAAKGSPRHENSSFVQELAQLLGRTPASIYMRMENFASIDPEESEHRRGLVKIGPLCAKVFRDWDKKRDHLSSCAQVLRRDAESPRSTQLGLFEPDPVALPRAFGKYELLDPIGQGGFGSVYSCMHVDTHQVGAIKIIHADKIHDHEILHRFVREIRALKEIDHPNIIRLHEENLGHEKAKWHASATPPALHKDEARTIVKSVIAALHELHSHSPRIIHRDLNPNNVLLLPDGRWVLADFGLAKFLDTVQFTTSFETRTRQSGWGAGYYGAPEQYRDFKHTDERTDVYALGVLVWELFTSVGPPMDRQNTGLPPALHEAFLKATDRSPDSRFVSVREFSEAFERALEIGGRP